MHQQWPLATEEKDTESQKPWIDVAWARTSNCTCLKAQFLCITTRESEPPPETGLEQRSHTSTAFHSWGSQAPCLYSPPVFGTSQLPKIWPGLPISQPCNPCQMQNTMNHKRHLTKAEDALGNCPKVNLLLGAQLHGFLLWHANNMWFTVSAAVLSLNCLLHSWCFIRSETKIFSNRQCWDVANFVKYLLVTYWEKNK